MYRLTHPVYLPLSNRMPRWKCITHVMKHILTWHIIYIGDRYPPSQQQRQVKVSRDALVKMHSSWWGLLLGAVASQSRAAHVASGSFPFQNPLRVLIFKFCLRYLQSVQKHLDISYLFFVLRYYIIYILHNMCCSAPYASFVSESLDAKG